MVCDCSLDEHVPEKSVIAFPLSILLVSDAVDLASRQLARNFALGYSAASTAIDFHGTS
jgi:hypothetical protein